MIKYNKMIEQLLPGVKKNIPLKDYTTFRIGGKARYFFIAKTKEDLIKAIAAAKKTRLPFFILGGGSNLLVSDKGFRGLVIKIKNQSTRVLCSAEPINMGSGQKFPPKADSPLAKRIKNTPKKSLQDLTGQENKKFKNVYCGAGATLSQVVNLVLKNNLTGIEWAAGIPGTLGGALRGNAGSFGGSIADVTESVEAFDAENLRFKAYDFKKCEFGYRQSIFKKNKNLIIYSAVLKLREGKKEKTREQVKAYLNYRRERHPAEPSAGSVFKNLQLTTLNYKLLTKKFPKLRQFEQRGDIPAAFLISECGLKSKKIGGAIISPRHPNFIVNIGNAKAKDAMGLIDLVKNKVKSRFGIKLEEEIQYLNH